MLAIDTATRMTGIALHDGDQVHAEYIWRGGQFQTVELAPEVALMMRRAGIQTRRLTALAVAMGPGSYTGLRIGMSLAKGMALARGLPMVGVPTLEILAGGQPKADGPMFALMKAGRSRFVGQRYAWQRGEWRARDEMRNMSWEEILAGLEAGIYLVGELDPEQRREIKRLRNVDLAPPSLCVRRPAIMAELAWDHLHLGEPTAAAKLAPIYQAGSDVITG